LSILGLVTVLKESARRRPRGGGTVGIINSPVARTHEEIGLREPAHGTAEVGTIDREDLEILPVQVSNPARNIRCLAIPGRGMGISKRSQPGLVDRKLLQPAEREPGFIAPVPPASHGKHDVPHDRHSQNRAGETVDKQSKLHE
jgi:hypothetical protein